MGYSKFQRKRKVWSLKVGNAKISPQILDVEIIAFRAILTGGAKEL